MRDPRAVPTTLQERQKVSDLVENLRLCSGLDFCQVQFASVIKCQTFRKPLYSQESMSGIHKASLFILAGAHPSINVTMQKTT